MPELPEVETTRRGIEPHIVNRPVRRVIVRQPMLRWPVPGDLEEKLVNRRFLSVGRRGKYLLVVAETGSLIIHLGMSGSLRIVDGNVPLDKHDHVDIVFDDETRLRLRDPRRFGAMLWSEEPDRHPLLTHLGPEPLGEDFDGRHLHDLSRGRTIAVKTFIMDSRVVVGVGNIYANEALYLAGIHPRRAAGKISAVRYKILAARIRTVLERAIGLGGTTLRDFVNEAGKPGYFQQTLSVYGREGEPCRRCDSEIRMIRLGQRSTFYCPRCQSR